MLVTSWEGNINHVVFVKGKGVLSVFSGGFQRFT